MARNETLRQKIQNIATAQDLTERQTQAAQTALESFELWSHGKLEASRLLWIRHFVKFDLLQSVRPKHQVNCWTSHSTFWSELFLVDRTLVNYKLTRSFTCTNIECPRIDTPPHVAIPDIPIMSVKPPRRGPVVPFVDKLMNDAIQKYQDGKQIRQDCASAWTAFCKLTAQEQPRQVPPCAGIATVVNTITHLPEIFLVDLINVREATKDHDWNLQSLPNQLQVNHRHVHATFELLGTINHSGAHYSTNSLFGNMWIYEDAMTTIRTWIKGHHHSDRFQPIQAIFLKRE